MTNGQQVEIGMCLIVPLLILRQSRGGGVPAMLLDAFDVVIVDFLGSG